MHYVNAERVVHITKRPALAAPAVLRATSLFVAIGPQGRALLEEFCQIRGANLPATKLTPPGDAAVVAWRCE